MAILGRHSRQPFASLGIDVAQIMRQLAGWHDIAKATAFFQEYISKPESWERKVRQNQASNDEKTHTPLDALLAADYFSSQAKGQPWFVPLLITLAIRGHHSRLLEADKALLINPTLLDYFGTTPRAYPATLVEDQLPAGDADSAINQQRRLAYQAVISDAASPMNDVRPRVLTLPTGLGKTRCAAGWAMHWRSRIERETGVRPKILVVNTKQLGGL